MEPMMVTAIVQVGLKVLQVATALRTREIDEEEALARLQALGLRFDAIADLWKAGEPN